MVHPVQVSHVTKRYRRHSRHRPYTLQEAVARGFGGLRPKETILALSEISFDVPCGAMAGIVGANGAGKSTLLRLVGGVGRPDSGSIRTDGRLGAMIDLGVGFHPDLTGRENVRTNGVIGGLTRREINARLDDIVDFAGLRDFIDSPLRTYSSGMWMRLAFAVATAVRPDILLVDEVLAVGDAAFQEKCLARIRDFKARGSSILLVTHQIGLVERLCDLALWLDAGRLVELGPAPQVAQSYLAHVQEAQLAQATD
ncbi:MAG: ABC transporter ATP-binding protein [Anaerolineae bacterium]|jgi:lipopolysaccharide transport system ATP-binding protein|nr:ABC transporter ATP-binding protein [Anaerolineae bacterium]